MSEWQPIENAPKDGRYIIVWPPSFRGVTSVACWDKQPYAKRPRQYWRRLDATCGNASQSRDNPPTHWMPIIAGPDEEPK